MTCHLDPESEVSCIFIILVIINFILFIHYDHDSGQCSQYPHDHKQHDHDHHIHNNLQAIIMICLAALDYS